MTAPGRMSLTAATYDALKLVADQFGGVGFGRFHDWAIPNPEADPWNQGLARVRPCCIHGIAQWALGEHGGIWYGKNLIMKELLDAGVTFELNDSAFTATERQQGIRLPFDVWARRVGVRRGV